MSERRHWGRKKRLTAVLGSLLVLGAGAYAGRRLLRDRRGDDVKAVTALLAAGQLKEAAPLLEQLAARDPRNVHVGSDLARCLVLLGRIDEAEQQALQVTARAPNFAPAQAVLSEVAGARGDVAARLDHARRAVAGRESPRGAREALIVALLDTGRADEAAGMLLALPDDRLHGRAMMELVLRMLQATGPGSPRQARLLDVLRAALAPGGSAQDSPRSAPADVLLRVRVALAAGDAPAAVAALRGAEKSRELDRRERAWLAHALARAGQRDLAVVVLDRLMRAISEDAEHPLSDEDAAVICTAQIAAGLYADARTTLAAAPAGAAEGAGARRLRLSISTAEAAAGDAAGVDWARVEADATAVLELRPADQAALAARAQARIASGQVNGALADVAVLRAIAQGSARADWLNGVALLASGMPDQALGLLERGRLAVSPDDASATLIRAAVGARRADVARQEALAIRAPHSEALILAVEALGANWTSVETGVRAASFDACPLADRLFALRITAQGGRGDLARIALDRIDPAPCPAALASSLAEAFGAAGAAEAAAAAAARAEAAGGRAAADAAALRARRDVLLAAADPAAASAAIDRLRATPGGAVPALLMDAAAAIARGDLDAARQAAKQAVQAAPNDPHALALLLRAEWESGAYQNEAFDTADRLLAIAPTHTAARAVRAQRLLGEASLAYGDLRADDAVRLTREAVELAPSAATPLFAAGVLGLRVGDLDQAYEDAEALRQLPGGAARGVVLQALIRYSQRRFPEAVAKLREAVAASPDDPQIRAGLVTGLLASGDTAAAIEAAETLVRMAPGSLDARRLQAAALSAGKRHDEAIGILDDLVRERPDAYAPRAALAQAYTAADRPVEALRALEAAAAACPDERLAYDALARALLTASRPDEAAAVADRLATRLGLAAAGALRRADLLGRSGDAAGELLALRHAVEAAPDDVQAQVALATRLVRDGADGDATAHLNTALQLAPRAGRAHLLLGTLAERSQDWDAALVHYEEALRIAPSDPVAANNVAWQLVRASRDLPRAVQLARRAVTRSPDVGEFRDTAALALAATGERGAAANEAERAAALLPENLDVATNAAELLAAAGRSEPARTLAQSVVRRAAAAERKDLVERGQGVLSQLDRE